MSKLRKIIGYSCASIVGFIIGYGWYQALKAGDGLVITLTVIIVFCLLVFGAVWGLSKKL